MMEFRREQRRVAFSMGSALLVTVILFGAILASDSAAPVLPIAERLEATLRADVFVVLWLAAGIANVARLRFFSETDIAGSGSTHASDPVRQAAAILQNTVEQVCLAVFAHLIVTASVGHPALLIHALVILFCVGRLLFWIGYRRGAGGRAFGFALTFYPSVIALLVSAVMTIMGWTTV